MLVNDKIWVAQGEVPCCLLLDKANRHGLIAGATGTGKTVTLKVLAEGFSEAGGAGRRDEQRPAQASRLLQPH